jgi:hypothetical protein
MGLTALAYRLNPPPGWPPVPDGFVPPQNWQPDPSWPPAPPGWQLWVPDGPQAPSALPAAPPYAPGPYAPGPYATWEQPKQGTNGFAIAAFVLGLLGGVVLSVIFGVVALNKLRRRPQRGKGLAIAGLVLSAVWVVAIGALVAVSVAGSSQRSASGQITKNGSLNVLSLRTGDCFQNPSGSQPASGSVERVTAVSCGTPHDAQVISQLPVSGSAYPGEAAFHAQAVTGCQASLDSAVDKTRLTATMNLIWIYPESQAWSEGQRSISCVVVDSTADLTSSLLNK